MTFDEWLTTAPTRLAELRALNPPHHTPEYEEMCSLFDTLHGHDGQRQSARLGWNAALACGVGVGDDPMNGKEGTDA